MSANDKKTIRVPHMMITARYRGAKFSDLKGWRCDYCLMIGSLDALQKGHCSFEYEPCPTCGGNPECTPDCAAMISALAEAASGGAFFIGNGGSE